VQGLSASMIQTTSYSIVAVCYQEQKQKYLGIVEASTGIGLIFGPAIGAFLYSFTNFETTFIIMGSLFVFLSFMLIVFVPAAVDVKDEPTEDWIETARELKDNGKHKKEHPVTYFSLLCDKSFFLFSTVAFVATFHSCYSEPVLALKFLEFDISSFTLGILFCIGDTGYSICLLIMAYWLTEERNINRYVMFGGLLFTGISHIFVGPAEFLPDSLTIMTLGQFLISFGGGIFFIPILPEMMKAAWRKFPNQKIEASDMSAGIMDFMFWMGQTIAPIYGSYASKYVGFRNCATLVSYSLIIFSIIFYCMTKDSIDASQEETQEFLKKDETRSEVD
jgi:MFS family permease